MQRLYRMGFLKSDEDALFEDDFERIHELFLDTIQMPHLKALETDLKKIIK